MRQPGGKMLDPRTRLHAAIPAERSASSKDVSFSRCLPTPFVKNISLGTNPTTSRSLSRGKVHGKQQLIDCQGIDRCAEALEAFEIGHLHYNLALIIVSYTNYWC